RRWASRSRPRLRSLRPPGDVVCAMRLVKPVAVAIALAALMLAGGANAAASCVQPRPLPEVLDESQTVFVGTVVYTWDSDRRARVHVESIWRGAQLPAYVEVHGSPADGA